MSCCFLSFVFYFCCFKLTFMLKWWNTTLSRNLSELLYLSLGRSSHKISPSSWKNAAKLTEKHDEWSTQSLPQSLIFFTEAETKGVMFKWRNLWTAKLAKAKPFPECRFKLFVPSRYSSLNAGDKEFMKMQNKIISNVADPNKVIFFVSKTFTQKFHRMSSRLQRRFLPQSMLWCLISNLFYSRTKTVRCDWPALDKVNL